MPVTSSRRRREQGGTATGREDGRSWRTPRRFVAGGSFFLAAAVVAAAARASEPFAHGIWLVAYLLLVGFLAQLLLGRWQAMLLGARRSDAGSPPIGAQAALWDAGVVAVPVGVLADARLFVVTGSIALLASLAAFGQTHRLLATETNAAMGRLEVRYLALIVFMASSVLAGTALAWDLSWL